ncbi:MAG TPA: phosphoribosylaminoimidazolesuccinocarboxamide synthase [Candidatus Saccharimonadales bacterium]|nr:phosphoribosylaminoimidazolesuccinocarboxamide synthase [Candidatus Saccharimonadales bacterium]
MIPHAEVILGSESDLHYLWDSELLDALEADGITYAVATLSAHRNAAALAKRINETIGTTGAYVCAAGWAAALPGVVKAHLLGRSLAKVYGIALPSDDYRDGKDAEISILHLPSGIDVAYGGVGVDGFNAIISDLQQQLWAYDPNPDPELLGQVLAKIKPPRFNIPKPKRGKTKRIEYVGNGEVLVRNMDDITAGDGARHDVIEGKGAASTRTTCNIFELLERHGVRTHFVKKVDDVTFRARDVDMIPLELIARRIATGSYLDRYPDVADGTVFEELVFEIFEKDDANHDPLLEFDFKAGVLRRYVPNKKAAQAIGDNVKAGDLISEEPLADSRYAGVTLELIEQLCDITLRAFEIIEEAWAALGGTYFDYKVEGGHDHETGELLVADVIDSDSGRLRFGDRDVSKESYRDGSQTLPQIKKNFDEVAVLTGSFV